MDFVEQDFGEVLVAVYEGGEADEGDRHLREAELVGAGEDVRQEFGGFYLLDVGAAGVGGEVGVPEPHFLHSRLFIPSSSLLLLILLILLINLHIHLPFLPLLIPPLPIPIPIAIILLAARQLRHLHHRRIRHLPTFDTPNLLQNRLVFVVVSSQEELLVVRKTVVGGLLLQRF